jgi:hypothetical protein
MQLTFLSISGTSVTDLTPLQGMPLQWLEAISLNIRDFSPLKGMPLEVLELRESTGPLDLSVFKGAPLPRGFGVVNFRGTVNCGDFFQGARLPGLYLHGCESFTDLSPLEGAEIQVLTFTPKYVKKGIEVVRGLKGLTQIGVDDGSLLPAQDFWKKYDAGEFSK